MWTVSEDSSKADRGEPMAIQRKKMPAKNAARRKGEMRSREERRRESQPRR